MTNLSEAAKRALINASVARGGKVALPNGPLLRQLKDDGYVGPGGGLTRRGDIAAMRAKGEAEGKAFG